MTEVEAEIYFEKLTSEEGHRFNLLVETGLKLGKPIEGAYDYAKIVMENPTPKGKAMSKPTQSPDKDKYKINGSEAMSSTAPTPIPTPANINRDVEDFKLIIFGWITTVLGIPEKFDPTLYNELTDRIYELFESHDQALRTKLIGGVDSLDKRYGEQYTRPISYQVIQDTKKVINHTYGGSV